MTLRLKLAGAVALAILLRAQSGPRFGVEILNSGYRSYYVALDGGIVSTYPTVNLERMPGASPPGRSPTDLRLEYKVENDSVVITASVIFADSRVSFDRPDDPPRQKLGVYSARMDQSVAISEMTQFGFEPFQLKIVPARPDFSFTSTPSARPQTISKASSVQIEIIGEDRMAWKVAVHNLSAKTVTAFSIFTPAFDGNGGGGQIRELDARQEIAPGATYEVQVSTAGGRRTTNGALVQDPPASQIILDAAFYQDGSYEGDVKTASMIGARRIGAGIQRERVDQLVEGILSDDQASDKAKVARIRAEADRLAEDPDQQMIERVQSQFPGLSEQGLEGAKSNLRQGLRSVKTALASGLKQFEARDPDFPAESLARWWSTRLQNRLR
jgi:hypothetical protein